MKPPSCSYCNEMMAPLWISGVKGSYLLSFHCACDEMKSIISMGPDLSDEMHVVLKSPKGTGFEIVGTQDEIDDLDMNEIGECEGSLDGHSQPGSLCIMCKIPMMYPAPYILRDKNDPNGKIIEKPCNQCCEQSDDDWAITKREEINAIDK